MIQRKDAPVIERPFIRVLVPVGFTEACRGALGLTRELLLADSALTVLHVMEKPIQPPPGPGMSHADETDPEPRKSIEQNLESRMGVKVGRLLVTEGDIATGILKAIEDAQAQLAVMGTRGLTRLDRFLLGSVAENVIRQPPGGAARRRIDSVIRRRGVFLW